MIENVAAPLPKIGSIQLKEKDRLRMIDQKENQTHHPHQLGKHPDQHHAQDHAVENDMAADPAVAHQSDIAGHAARSVASVTTRVPVLAVPTEAVVTIMTEDPGAEADHQCLLGGATRAVGRTPRRAAASECLG